MWIDFGSYLSQDLPRPRVDPPALARTLPRSSCSLLIQQVMACALFVSPLERAGGRGEPWSAAEVAATVEDYFAMLRDEIEGRPYVKADYWRGLRARLDGRTKGAIEQKHMNISAILRDLGYPFIAGYKPLANYQGLLREKVEERLTRVNWLPRTDSTRKPKS
jgi:hypothetical protein